MGITTKIQKWRQLSSEFKFILFKGVGLSFINEIFLRLNIYKPLKAIHQNEDETDDHSISSEEMIHLQRISKTMRLIEKYAPWQPKCYNRALTAKKLLADKHISSRLHIGFRKKDGAFDGHAWITYKGKIITGKINGMHTFNELKPLASA